jgi:hypothetical protein
MDALLTPEEKDLILAMANTHLGKLKQLDEARGEFMGLGTDIRAIGASGVEYERDINIYEVSNKIKKYIASEKDRVNALTQKLLKL